MVGLYLKGGHTTDDLLFNKNANSSNLAMLLLLLALQRRIKILYQECAHCQAIRHQSGCLDGQDPPQLWLVQADPFWVELFFAQRVIMLTARDCVIES